MKINTTTITLIVLAILIVLGGYWYFSAQSGNQLPLTTDATVNEAQAHFQALVSELQPISFDTKIFSDVRFNALVDLATPVTPEPTGRIDPFAPVAGIGL